MRRRPRSPMLALGALATLGALVAIVALAPATQATTPQKPLRYVALGDSYSAASGVLPVDPEAPPNCLRSTLNYPHVIAEKIGANLTDVTCGGAATRDYFKPQYDNVEPQLKALTKRTRLVTMTIGGNDGGVFVDTIVNCGTAANTAVPPGSGNPCEQQYGNEFERKIKRDTFPAIVRALKAVHRKAPRARVAILGYPRILPAKVGCYPQMPVARGDVPYLNGIQSTLNDAVRRAAKRTGTRYVNFNRVSRGHDACKGIGERWIEPVLFTTNPVIVHPNELGERRMAQRTIRVLKLR
ncbi:SGNH/GDSL hydrolase family protein [Thermoleophilia bacterium SCSIO 60948]|nr:SGNH/GDSL hydrolase family protein [Thermoleophilia bacterium SCSIO 60948]